MPTGQHKECVNAGINCSLNMEVAEAQTTRRTLNGPRFFETIRQLVYVSVVVVVTIQVAFKAWISLHSNIKPGEAF